jgi:trans-aconitate methyltransferase
MRFNSQAGKAVLAAVRGGDYAHPGEEASVRLVWDRLPKRPEQRVLDAGCGRGGTAALVQAEGWGRVTGFDIEGGSIEEARRRYPEVRFEACDVSDAPVAAGSGFQGIYALTAFYAFPDQDRALRALRETAEPGAWLAIMDYSDHGGYAASELARTDEAGWWKPVRPERIRGQLAASGWACEAEEDWSGRFEQWYAAFATRMELKRAEVETLAGPGAYAELHRFYTLLWRSVRQGDIGGIFIRARAV